MSLGERLKLARKRKGMTQMTLAKRVGTSQSTINDIENGRHKSSRFLMSIADVLQVDARWLERGDGVLKGVSVEVVNQGGPLPLYDWDRIPDLLDDNCSMPMVDALYRCPISHSDEAYTLQVLTDQYEGHLSYGDVLFVDPVGSYSSNDLVVCVMTATRYVDLRLLVFDGASTYLKSINRNVPEERRLLSARLEAHLGGQLAFPVTNDPDAPPVALVGRVIFRGCKV